MSSQHSEGGSLVPIGVPLPPEKLEYLARIGLRETKELREICLCELKKLVKERDIPCVTEDYFLLRFLRARKFLLPRALNALQQYAEQRVVLHNLFLALRPEVLKKCLDLNIIGILPYRDSDGRLVVFWRSGIWLPEICPIEEMLAVALVVFSYAVEDQASQISGVTVIFDQTKIILSQMPYLMPYMTLLKSFLLNSLPARYSKFHIINESFMTMYAMRIISPFLPEKINNRIMHHGKKREVLFKHIPAAILPTAFGGNLGRLSNDHLTGPIVKFLLKLQGDQHHFFRRKDGNN